MNLGSRQAIGLIAWYPGSPNAQRTNNNLGNLVNSQFTLTNNGTVPSSFDQSMGRVMTFNGSSQYYEMNSAIITSYPFTMAAWAMSTSQTLTNPIFQIGNSTVATNRSRWWISFAGAGTDGAQFRNASSNGVTQIESTTQYVAGRWHHVCAVATSSTAYAVFLDAAGKNTGTTDRTPSGLDRTTIGRQTSTGSGDYHVGPIAEVRLYKTALSDTAVYALYDPDTRWELYYPIGRVSYFFSSGAQAFSLALDAGSYSVGGVAMTPTAQRLLSMDAGTYSVSGSDATLSHGYLLSCDSGTYAVTGQAASLLSEHILSANAGVYTLSGAAAEILAARLLSGDPGIYAVSGFNTDLRPTRLLSADAGSYTLSGMAAELPATRLLSGNPGTYAISGSDASILASRLLSADPGTYTIVGFDATLISTGVGSFLLVAEPGSYSISGQDASILAARQLPLDPGIYTLSGQAATNLVARLLSADAGGYTVSGFATNVLADRFLNAQVGAYQIDGKDANLIFTGTGAQAIRTINRILLRLQHFHRSSS